MIKETELYDLLNSVINTSSNTEQENSKNSTDSIKKDEKAGISETPPLKGKGLLFLDSIMENSPFIQNVVKFTAVGAAMGYVLSSFFPPLGIAIMVISAIGSIVAIGAKAAQHYGSTKAENSYNKELTETKDKILSDILRELLGKKLSKTEMAEINAKESRLAIHTKSINNLMPNVKQDGAASKLKVMKNELQGNKENLRMRRTNAL